MQTKTGFAYKLKKLEEIKLNMDALQRNFENQLLTLENKPGK